METKFAAPALLLVSFAIVLSGCVQESTGQVNVEIVDEKGQPVKGAYVAAYSNYSLGTGINSKWTNIEGTIEATATTGKDGKATMQLLPGDYVLRSG